MTVLCESLKPPVIKDNMKTKHLIKLGGRLTGFKS